MGTGPGELHFLCGKIGSGKSTLSKVLAAEHHAVVLDFPANTVEQRRWMKDLAYSTNAPHTLHYLDVPNGVCKARLKARNATGEHPFEVAEDQFEKITSHLVPPSVGEGGNMVVHKA